MDACLFEIEKKRIYNGTKKIDDLICDQIETQNRRNISPLFRSVIKELGKKEQRIITCSTNLMRLQI